MLFSWKSATILIAVISFTNGLGNHAINLAETNESQQIKIRFNAKVGNQSFECGRTYTGLGKSATTITPTDFRFYVSDVSLIDATGRTVPLSLSQDGKWQYQNVALLDFENKSGPCSNGTTEVRDYITGTVPKGNYRGLQFTLGLPFQLNHEDSTLAPSPLNLTSLWWNWQSGYKFLRIDLSNQNHDQHKSAGISKDFPIHLGSSGCQATGDNQKALRCSYPNTTKVIFTNFDINKNTVVADLKALVANTNLAVNQTNTPPGCMSLPEDKDCISIMDSLGISFANHRSNRQTFFKVK